MVENITLRNVDTNATLELDKVTTPYYVLESVTWGEVKAVHHSYKYVNQIGESVTGTSLSTREVDIIGWIIADTELQMTERKMMLNRFVNPQHGIELLYSKYKLKFLPNSSIKYSATIAENNDVICKFNINGLAADPRFSDNNDNRISAATTRGMFRFPLAISNSQANGRLPSVMMGLREPSLIVNVYNRGTIATGMRIVFKALGTLKSPSLTSVYTQEYFKINKQMVAGEMVEVVTNIGEKKVVAQLNGVEMNYFKYRDLSSTWLQLEIGDNLFRYDAEEGIDNLEVYIYFSNKYLEVQGCY